MKGLSSKSRFTSSPDPFSIMAKGNSLSFEERVGVR
jgi:hypothetical protein